MFDSVENALKGGGRKVVRGVYGRDVYRSQVRKRIETLAGKAIPWKRTRIFPAGRIVVFKASAEPTNGAAGQLKDICGICKSVS